LETFTAAFLEKKPFEAELLASKLANPVATFETNTFEGIFPFLTSRFGKNVPSDLIIKIKRIYDVQAYADNSNVTDNSTFQGMISVKIDIDCEVRVNYPGGVNKSIGHAEWQQTVLKVNIIQSNGTIFKVHMYSGNITK
jgi:hypothetical protein